jgi:hypothetical protein
MPVREAISWTDMRLMGACGGSTDAELIFLADSIQACGSLKILFLL